MAVRRLGAVLLLLLTWVPAGSAWAHAAPARLDPPNGAVVASGPVTLRLGLDQPVELKFSKVTVRSGGQSWDASLRPEGGGVVAAVLPDLPPGRYDVTWRVLSADGHLTEGTYSIILSEQAAPTAAAAGAPAAAPARFPAILLWTAVMGVAVVSAVLVARRLRQSLLRE